jgi:hypothetical protein
VTHYDRDVWMQLHEEKDGYNYIYKPVDDFKVIARNPCKWMDMIETAFLLKSVARTNNLLPWQLVQLVRGWVRMLGLWGIRYLNERLGVE